MKYEIWQTDEGNGMAYMTLKQAEILGYKPSVHNYHKVYECELYVRGNDMERYLNSIFTRMLFGKPVGFTGRQIGMSDIIVLGGHAYFIEKGGYTEISFEGRRSSYSEYVIQKFNVNRFSIETYNVFEDACDAAIKKENDGYGEWLVVERNINHHAVNVFRYDYNNKNWYLY